MDTLRDVLLVIHLLGMAALFGGAFVQIRDEVVVVNAAMLHGALTQVVSGILLVGVIEGQDDPIDHTKVAVKFAVAWSSPCCAGSTAARSRCRAACSTRSSLLTVANVCVAVFWSMSGQIFSTGE